MQSPPHKAPASRHPFQPPEDALLIQILSGTEFANWESIAQQFTGRTARQCRERWINYLCPGVRTGPWTAAEDELLIANLGQYGHAWSLISRAFNGRSESDIKNRWYSHLRHETVVGAGGRLIRGRAERKRRQRSAVDAKANALKLLERAAGDGGIEEEVVSHGRCPEAGQEISGWPIFEIPEYEEDGFWCFL